MKMLTTTMISEVEVAVTSVQQFTDESESFICRDISYKTLATYIYHICLNATHH